MSEQGKRGPMPWEWRPFSSAPKDRTEILVYREDAGVFTALYAPARAADGEEDEDNYCWFTTTGEDIDDDLPTHWMPLPNGPDVVDAYGSERARLVAAPDLLDALDGMRSALEFYVKQVGPVHEAGCAGDDTCECPNMKLVNDAWSQSEAAIAKARGEHT